MNDAHAEAERIVANAQALVETGARASFAETLTELTTARMRALSPDERTNLVCAMREVPAVWRALDDAMAEDTERALGRRAERIAQRKGATRPDESR